MSIDAKIAYAALAVAWILIIFWLGEFVGGVKQRSMWKEHMDRCNRYINAVDDLDRWCGHTSPHAKLIARHLYAHGQGLGYNGGTPCGDEACDISGLREQLKRLDRAAASIGSSGEREGLNG